MSESRTFNSLRNISTAVINKVLSIIAPFILRTIILYVLGAKYLGLNGLFTSILQVLNITELGVTSAIVYSLYEPIAKGDITKVGGILNLIKKAYRVIAFVILIVGIVMISFLDRLITGEYPTGINIRLLFFIYLMNVFVSYIFFAYRNCLLTALQRSDIKNHINSAFKIFELVLQIIVLILFKNMYLFVLVQVFSTINNNVVSYWITVKKFPQYNCCGRIGSEDKANIVRQILGLMLDKICCVTRNSFDSIFVSTFLGLEIVAQYDNYAYIGNSLYSLVNIIVASLVASIGNAVATESVEKNYDTMNQLMFVFAWMYGLFSVMLLCLFQPFMKIWVGEKMMLNNRLMIMFVMYFYAICMGVVRAIYVQAVGIWWKEKNRAIIETICNLLFNIILIKLFGLIGVIIGTCLSLVIINFLYGSKYIFIHYFGKEHLKSYYLEHLKYVVCTVMIGMITYFICCNIVVKNIMLDIVVKALISFILPNILVLLLIKKTRYYLLFKSIIGRIIGNLRIREIFIRKY